MFWIFRRSKLSGSFFSSLNGNNNKNAGSGSNGAINNNTKGYNKLSAEEADYHQCVNNNNNAVDNHHHHNNNNNNKDDSSLWSCTGGGHRHEDSDTDSSCSDFDVHEEDDFSDDTDFDEALTCNVCDRSFATPRQLAHHQQKKRHFGCSACDSLFPSLMALEHHKEEFEHWSGDELSVGRASCEEDEDDESLETVCSEELERLL